MLSGEAVVAIWNDITASGRDDFYAWHLHEHMPERAGIPGFRRGRRYIATDDATQPEFFTLYEADAMGVLQGSDYLSRLNAPTPWTRRATAEFRNTSRALARVLHSEGPGTGGVALTLRFDARHERALPLAALIRQAATAPRVTGAHLCAADDEASGQRTAESAGRTDLQPPPSWFAMLEATDREALADLLPEPELRAAGGMGAMARGLYRLEYTRTKTAFAAG
jgi:hypothetical protein